MRKKAEAILRKIIPNIEINLTVPDNDKFGHYSTNIAFRAGLNAEDIVRKVKEKAPAGLFKKIEAMGGFVNFWLTDEVLQKELVKILRNTKWYESIKKSKQKIQVEFVSANPTGPLTLANGRGGFLGDVLSNVLEAAGHKVEREYYVNDTGNQILILGKSIIVALGLNLGQKSGQPKDEIKLYKGEYVKKWAGRNKANVKKYQNNPLKLGQLAAKDFLKDIKKVLSSAGIKFDRWTLEDKHIHKKSFVKKALKVFRSKKLTYKKEGALWLKTTNFGDDKDRVLVTSDGFPTYFLADSGHYLETKTRGFAKKVNILGPDHFGYVKRIQAAARIVGLKNSEIIVTQAVRLVKSGEEIKMSKRKGEFVTFEELVEEVGADAARFFFMMVSPDTHMDFDLAIAKERSVKNPVYYAQYAYVRAANIIKKARRSNLPNIDINVRRFDLQKLNTAHNLNLIRKLVQFPEVLEDTVKDYQVHRLTRYSTDLARAFHNFYEKERVVGEEKSLAVARLALVRASAVVFKNLLDILGISAPKKM